MAMATLRYNPFLNSTSLHRKLKLNHPPPPLSSRRTAALTVAFRRENFDSFKDRVVSGEVWRDAWRSANDGFEQLVFDAKKAAERFDRRYSVSRRLSSARDAASIKVREFDREFQVSRKLQDFSLEFSRNSPRYRKQLQDFINTPLGGSFVTIFFLWFALSGWLFRSLLWGSLLLPLAGPLLLKAVIVQGACPSCKREFIGSKTSEVRCMGCGNVVWQPKGDFFSGGKKGNSRSKSQPDIIDVDFEEK